MKSFIKFADTLSASMGKAFSWCIVILMGGTLIEANFQNANLMEANFTSSNITNANFDGANLIGATWTGGETCGPGSIGTCNK